MNDKHEFDLIKPVGKRILIEKDEKQNVTTGGIILPAATGGLPVITGRVINLSYELEDKNDFDKRQDVKIFDRIMYHPFGEIPVDVEKEIFGTNRLYIIELSSIIAVLSSTTAKRKAPPPLKEDNDFDFIG